MLLGLQCSVRLCPLSLGVFLQLEVQHRCAGGRPVVLVCSTNSGFAGRDRRVQGCSGLMSRKRLPQDGLWSCPAPGRQGWTPRARWQPGWCSDGQGQNWMHFAHCLPKLELGKVRGWCLSQAWPVPWALWCSSKLGAKQLKRGCVFVVEYSSWAPVGTESAVLSLCKR